MEQKIQAKLENKQAKKEALAEIQRKHITLKSGRLYRRTQMQTRANLLMSQTNV